MRIVGISLVHNEERFIEHVLLNALALCDCVLVLDNESVDQTPVIVDRHAAGDSRIRRLMVPKLSQTHAFADAYVGTDTWVFGVDGDEVYDPAGLRRLRHRLLAGEFRSNWMVRAHFLHVTQYFGRIARGYMAPPSHDPSKLFNMSLVRRWETRDGLLFSACENGFALIDGGSYYTGHRFLNRETDWDGSDFRCLHLRFVSRSVIDGDTDRQAAPRLNPYDRTFHKATENRRDKYRQGELATVDTRPFLRRAA